MIERIESISHAGAEVYSSLTDRQLRSMVSPEEALIVVESPKVILTALASGLEPVSLLTEERHLTGDAAPILSVLGEEVPVYTGSRELLMSLTGYKLTRGVLCAMRRPRDRSAAEICRGGSRLAFIHGVCDTTNIGSIFRSAAAMGLDGVLLSRDSCDPLNRRSIRVSMGTVFQIPWGWTSGIEEVRDLGFRTVAMALTQDSVALDDPRLKEEERLAIILGTEGDGLPEDVISGSDYRVMIPMYHGVDSLNVGAAAAVAFWELRKRGETPNT